MELWKRPKSNILRIIVMNTKQKVVLWVGIGIIGILLVYPPYKLEGGGKLNLGHRNIITPLAAFTNEQAEVTNAILRAGKTMMKIDVLRLVLECVLVVAITAGGIWAFKEEKNKIV
jgi:hypothetical protein